MISANSRLESEDGLVEVLGNCPSGLPLQLTTVPYLKVPEAQCNADGDGQ